MSIEKENIDLDVALSPNSLGNEKLVYILRSSDKVETGKVFDEQTKQTIVQYAFVQKRLPSIVNEICNVKPQRIIAFRGKDIGTALTVLSVLQRNGIVLKSFIVSTLKTKAGMDDFQLEADVLDWSKLSVDIKSMFIPKKYRSLPNK